MYLVAKGHRLARVPDEPCDKIVLDRILNTNKSSVCHLGKKYKFMII